jgi:hypothetical protein
VTPQQPATNPITTAIANVTAAEAVYTADAPTLATIQTAITANAGPLPLQSVAQVLADIQANITALQQLIQAAAGQINVLVAQQQALTAVQAFGSLTVTASAVSAQKL